MQLNTKKCWKYDDLIQKKFTLTPDYHTALFWLRFLAA